MKTMAILITMNKCPYCEEVKKLMPEGTDIQILNASVDKEARLLARKYMLETVPAIIDGDKIYRTVSGVKEYIKTTLSP